MPSLERRLETLLWSSRLIVVVAVICCVLLALVGFTVGAVDTVQVLGGAGAYAGLGGATDGRTSARADVVAGMVKAVDAFLIGAILLVVALGLYELFVSRIDAAETAEVAPRLLLIRSLDDLKARVARLILLVLVVEFFGLALKLPVSSPQDLLLLALGVFLIGATLYLSGREH